jgi:hypothetical protein
VSSSASRYAGTWLGSRLVRPTGGCRIDEPMKTVELTLDVHADGTVLVSAGRTFVGTGTISTGGELLLVNERAFAMCGTNERRYVRQLEGRVRRVGEQLRLELKGEDPV